MRTASTLVLAALAPLGAALAQQKVDIVRASTNNVSVRLSGALGQVKITAWDKDSVALTGGLGAGSRLEGGPYLNQGMKFTVDVPPVSGMKFFVEASDEAALRTNKLEVHVPRNARVWIKTGSADIEANGVTGGLDLNIVGGSVRVNAKPRELIIESMDGPVWFTGYAEFARIKTATGDINLQGAGDDINATSISGAVVVSPSAAGACQRGRFETVTGPITFAADVARGGNVRFDSHSGAIELRLLRPFNAEFDIETITGSIENAYSPSRPTSGREGRGASLNISSGQGGASVVVRSFKGNVKLTTR